MFLVIIAQIFQGAVKLCPFVSVKSCPFFPINFVNVLFSKTLEKAIYQKLYNF